MATKTKDSAEAAEAAAAKAATAKAPKAAYYVFPSPGSTFLAGGKPCGWAAYEVVEAAEGALDHVGGGKKYATPAAAEKAAAALKAKAQKK